MTLSPIVILYAGVSMSLPDPLNGLDGLLRRFSVAGDRILISHPLQSGQRLDSRELAEGFGAALAEVGVRIAESLKQLGDDGRIEAGEVAGRFGSAASQLPVCCPHRRNEWSNRSPIAQDAPHGLREATLAFRFVLVCETLDHHRGGRGGGERTDGAVRAGNVVRRPKQR